MKAIIIEDEILAAKRLENMILAFDPNIEIVARPESVAESVEWFKANEQPDLIFLDIQLEDGLSFSIFEQVEVSASIIFTTAYDEYAIKAFKLKSIDYLLKPIVQEDLNKAITKYRNWEGKKQVIDINEIYKLMQVNTRQFRERFSVSVGQKLKTIEVTDIAYFFSVSGITFLVMKTKNQYSLEMSLDALSHELDPKQFFRINRQYLVHISSIGAIHVFPKSRLKLELVPPTQDDIFVSIDKVSDFKRWIDGRE